ncbi:MAG: hypothetical protein ACJ75L_10535 [Gaiellaceae bacterium]
MNDGHLSLEQEMILGAPLYLYDDEHVCDRRDCVKVAGVIIPGAVLCHDCAEEFGVGVGRAYRVPLAELTVSDFRFTRARADEYEALLRERRERLLIPTTPEAEAKIADLVRAGVDAFIRSAGAQP